MTTAYDDAAAEHLADHDAYEEPDLPSPNPRRTQ